MKPNALFTTLRFVAALITVAAIIGKPYLPLERLTIYPGGGTVSNLYGTLDSAGKADYGWLDPNEHSWWCNHKPNAASCGINLTWGAPAAPTQTLTAAYPACEFIDTDEDGDGWGWENETSCEVTEATRAAGRRLLDQSTVTNTSARLSGTSAPPAGTSETDAAETEPARGITIDFSRYDGINIKIHYEGKAKYLEVYLRQQTDPLPNTTVETTGKFMSVYLRTEDLKAGPAYIDLSEFSVAEWWILDTNAPRELALPEFDKIYSIGVDHLELGMHKMRIDSVELVGERISNMNFLFAILIFWGIFLGSEAALRYYWLYKDSRQREALINNLTSTAESLEEEKHHLNNLATTDALTGVLNREGLRQYLHNEFGGEYLPSDFGALVIDIDHFKHINDAHGHDVGDAILKTMTRLIAANIRQGDIFARWGGEEFLVVSREYSERSLFNLAEKLRLLIAEQPLETTLNLHITVSIGVARARRGENFGMTFKRADIALYKAKHTRNCVVQEK